MAMSWLGVVASLAVMVMFNIMVMTPAIIPVVVEFHRVRRPLYLLLPPIRSSSSTSHISAGVVRSPIAARSLLVLMVWLSLRRLILQWWRRRHLLRRRGRWSHGKIGNLLLEHADVLLEGPHLLLCCALFNLSLLLCGLCLFLLADGG